MNIKKIKYAVTAQCLGENVEYLKSEESRIFVYQLPSYGNIGDQAIAMTMLKFLNDNFSDYKIIENRIKFPKFKGVENLTDSDKVVLIGGGNFGDLYLYEMWFRNHVIKNHPDIKIFIFPVSIYYVNDRNLLFDRKYYDENVNLMLREPLSYNIANSNLKSKNILVPDIVNYCECDYKLDRSGICIMKRNDLELLITLSELLIQLENENINDYVLKDNHVDFKISNSEQMEKVVLDQLRFISKFNLLITDRLHGMIFAHITNTPVIVLKANIKIEESYYKWYSNIDNIHLLNSIDDLTYELCKEVSNSKNSKRVFTKEHVDCILDIFN